MKNINKFITIALGVSVLGFASCKKSFLDRSPTDQASTAEVFTTIEGAEAAVQGLHRTMYEVQETNTFGYPSLAIMWDLMGEDLVLSGIGSGWFVTANRFNDARNPGSTGSYMWSYFYRIAHNANMILANVDQITGNESRKEYVKASALFYRAFAYYNLSVCYMHTYAGNTTQRGTPLGAPLNFSGNFKDAQCIPIYTSPTQKGNKRSTVTEVYTQITSDLDKAIELFNNSGVSRVDVSNINVNVAEGLYARVALVMQDWDKAAAMADAAGSSSTFMSKERLTDGFSNADNPEWIWGSIINTEQNGIYASFLSQFDYDLNGYASLGQQKKMNSKFMSTGVLEAIDTNDVRRKWWWSRAEIVANPGVPYAVNSQRKFRAKDKTSFKGDFPLMRKAEMALIKAEALIQDGQLSAGKVALEEFVHTRYPLFVSAGTLDSVAIQIQLQRRVELWGEGFRYSDLMRSFAVPHGKNVTGLDRTSTGGNSGIYVISSLSPYNDEWLFQIPTSEINVNKIPRNP